MTASRTFPGHPALVLRTYSAPPGLTRVRVPAGARHRRRRLRRREPRARARRAPSRLGGRRARQPQAPRLGAEPAAAARRRASRSSTATCASRDDLAALGRVDAIVECSAEPSVARRASTAPPTTSVHTNLVGAYHCLELAAARRRAGRLPLDEPRLPGRGAGRARATRRRRRASSSRPSSRCPARRRPASPRTSRSTGARTLYGATKLAAELLVAEYRDGLRPARRRSTAAA